MKQLPGVLLAALAAGPARAAEAAPTDTGVTGGFLQAVLGLALVLALIWGAAWLVRRLQPGIGGAHGALKIVAAQGVGQRERIVVVEIAEQWLVVGVAAGSVNTLAVLPKGTLPPTANATASFAGLLARARGTGEAKS
ncbi:MAG: flagellar biosynthetic protein FliO [Casimicrobiaceae bacterium]